MPNRGATGYYRWSVPRPMLLALAREAATAMTPAERIGFLGNLRALLGAGETRGDDYLAVLAEMADDPEPMPGLAQNTRRRGGADPSGRRCRQRWFLC